jgi:hypothetical protein
MLTALIQNQCNLRNLWIKSFLLESLHPLSYEPGRPIEAHKRLS